MAKSKKLDRKSDTHCNGAGLHKLSSRCTKICGDAAYHGRSHVKATERREWEDAVCSVCMEHPHNAVLLLCSSYDKGCRPFMCATSHRFSNCLKQYKKAYTKSLNQTAAPDLLEDAGGKPGGSELLCPLCRCPVKGWTVVETARGYLNAKPRACMQDNCSFVGTYKELRKHVKKEHPLACPRAVDPTHAAKWKKLENENDLRDVVSTIRSAIPGAIIIGDYVIERSSHRDYDDDAFPFQRWNRRRFPAADLFEEDFRSSRVRVAAPPTGHRARFLVARRAARLRAGR